MKPKHLTLPTLVILLLYSVGSIALAQGHYSCDFVVQNEYGVPLQREVFLGVSRLGTTHGEWNGITDEQGRAVAHLSTAEPVDYLICGLAPSPGEVGILSVDAYDPDGSLPDGTHLQALLTTIPLPTYTKQFRGLMAGDATASLYQSGAYDKVIVIAEPMQFTEQKDGPRTPADLWKDFRLLLRVLHRYGVDVWLVNAFRTGQNIHEQAAEYAQAVKYAALDYPAQYGHGPSYGGKVVLAGYSLGGPTLRIATARWEADAKWRKSLDLPDELPASLLIFGDAPLRGAQVNVDLQKYLWGLPGNRQSDVNLNSCAFQQLVKESAWPGSVTASNHANFFFMGGPVLFPGPSPYCDSSFSTGIITWCVCHAHPAVTTINGDGWAHSARKVAFSNGKWNEPIACYRDGRDLTRDGKDVCQDSETQHPWVPSPGQRWGHLEVSGVCGDPLPFDGDFYAAKTDLVPGSRQGFSVAGLAGGPWYCPFVGQQFFAPTFIPITSALAAADSATIPFDRWSENDHSGVHAVVKPGDANYMLVMDELARVFNLPTNLLPVAVVKASVSQSTLEVSFDASESTAFGIITNYEWSFGDKSGASGVSVTHVYPAPGRYTVALRVTDSHGSTSTITQSVELGLQPIPQAPPTPDGPEGCLDTLAPTFSWSAVDSADSFRLYVIDAADGQTVLIGATVYGATSFTPATPLPAAKKLYWKVKGRNRQGQDGPYSRLTYFDTPSCSPEPLPPAPPPIYPPAPPTPEVCLDTRTPTFSWSAVDNAYSYKVYVMDALLDDRIWVAGTVYGTTSYTPATPLPTGKKLYWKVKGRNRRGEDGPYSQIAYFSTPPCPNQVPVARPGGPYRWVVNQPVQFYGSGSSDPDGTIASYTWDFGDGTPAGNGPAPTHTYTAIGTYPVTLTVTDNAGASSPGASTTVTVVMPSTPSSGVKGDFNGDGKPDLLWRHSTDGWVSSWSMDGTVQLDAHLLGPGSLPDPAWQIVGTDDFNGDGHTDLVWQHATNGRFTVWFMNGRAGVQAAAFADAPVPDSNWRIVATGDFNGDGKPDLVWRHYGSGWNAIWYMDGLTQLSANAITPVEDINWQIVGAADFNQDGHTDLVWQHATGSFSVWFMHGTALLRAEHFPDSPLPDTNWELSGVGDFNGDGKPDLVWRHYGTGWNRIWYMDGLRRLSANVVTPDPVADTHWLLVGPR